MAVDIKNMMYNSLKSTYQALIDSAETTLEIYFTKSVGIGEHPQHLDEMTKLIDVIASNEDRIDILKKYFSSYSQPEDIPNEKKN